MKLEIAAVVRDGGKFHFEKVAQISEGGMLLKIRKALVMGDVIEIQFILPNKKFVEATGQIIYELKSGTGQLFAGIKFLQLKPEAQRVIRDYVAETVAAGNT